MLQKLYIKNLAIIEELLIDFESGLNIITGETGSGKSLIIQSIQLLLGKKITKELLRTGADELIIDGMFYYNKEEINIRRIYNSNGKSISYIDEHPVKVSELLNVTKKMVDIQGQHEHQMLLDPKNHIHYLDAFAMNLADVKEIKNSFYKMKKYQADLDLMKEEQKHIKEKEDLYRFQIQELKLYPISDAYEKGINNKYILLSNATEIQDSLNSCDKLLNNENDGIVLKLLKIACKSVNFLKVRKMHFTGLKRSAGFFQEKDVSAYNVTKRSCVTLQSCKQRRRIDMAMQFAMKLFLRFCSSLT